MADSKQLITPAIIALGVSLGATWAGFLVDEDSPWFWVPIAIQAVAVILAVIFLVRLVRAQRDDYWKERGRDPRNPSQSG